MIATKESNKVLIDFIKLLVVFWAPVTVLVYLQLYSVSIFYFGLLVLLVRIRKPYFLISLFVYFLPLSSIIGTENNLFGLIGFDELISLAFLSFFIGLKTKKPPLTRLQKNAIRIIILIVAYYLYYNAKGIIYGYDLGVDKTSIFYVFKLLIKFVLKYGPLILLIRFMGFYKVRVYVFTAVLMGLATIFVSMMMVDLLLDLGFYLPKNEFSIAEVETGVTRAMGFYNAGGDTNSTAGFFLVAFGYYLAQYEHVKKLKLFLIVFGITVLGLFLTASRTGFISLVLMMMLFFSRNYKSRSAVKLMSFGLLFVILSFSVIVKTVERFYAESAYEALDKNNVGRLGYYYIYGEYFVENPETMIAGYTDNPIWYKRPPHNFFVLMLYNAGILFPGLFLFYLFRIMRDGKRSSKHLYLVYMVIPLFLILSTINSEGSGIYFWLFISSVPFFYKGRDQVVLQNK